MLYATLATDLPAAGLCRIQGVVRFLVQAIEADSLLGLHAHHTGTNMELYTYTFSLRSGRRTQATNSSLYKNLGLWIAKQDRKLIAAKTDEIGIVIQLFYDQVSKLLKN